MVTDAVEERLRKGDVVIKFSPSGENLSTVCGGVVSSRRGTFKDFSRYPQRLQEPSFSS